MKTIILLNILAFSISCFAVEPTKKLAAKQETHCVTKDKKGNCPLPPKSDKPTPKTRKHST